MSGAQQIDDTAKEISELRLIILRAEEVILGEPV
jgi:hypothetical protein